MRLFVHLHLTFNSTTRDPSYTVFQPLSPSFYFHLHPRDPSDILLQPLLPLQPTYATCRHVSHTIRCLVGVPFAHGPIPGAAGRSGAVRPPHIITQHLTASLDRDRTTLHSDSITGTPSHSITPPQVRIRATAERVDLRLSNTAATRAFLPRADPPCERCTARTPRQ